MTTNSHPKNNIPGSYGYPIAGELFSLVTNEQLFYWKRYQKYGAIYKTSFLGKKTVIIAGPEINRAVLKDQAYKFSSYSGWQGLEPLIGKGLLLQDGLEHQHSRKLIFPAFSKCAISQYFTKIKSIVEDFLKEYCLDTDKKLISVSRALTLKIIINILLTSNHKIDIDKTSQLFHYLIDGMLAYIRLDIPFITYGKALKARRDLFDELEIIVKDTQGKTLSHDDSSVIDFLVHSTDESGNSLSNNEIISQIFQLVLGGHETTAKLLCWTIIMLSRHIDWQSKLRNEYYEVVGDSGLTVDHLPRLKLMDAVLKEVERLYPPLYFIPRGIISDFEFSGFTFTSDWLIHLSPLITHRMSSIYTNPHDFDPERFLPPREEHNRYPYSLIGFGGGKHFCLGNELANVEMKIILATLITNYSFDIFPNVYFDSICKGKRIANKFFFRTCTLH
ncbi:cytochrome P450 [Acaryochloris sp. CCMEE 5410]|uniref:cytochrome P450 n=1 Tax=Acaryochloris sp. CCMEE 5410 TaxID=310037 RepID=UPI0002483EB3|nr:cytochrome P450 [Acaryochloris sp. CCMEE 5410]KAI9129770.1 cytochrome P450 [Acaryochloris sp. CCMEE 5410]